MTYSNINFKTGTVIELSFATINKGKENQLFAEYFPKVLPIVSDLGGQSLGAFVVTSSSSQLDDPEMGAFFQWDNIDAFKNLHKEPRFLEIKQLRDNALKYFTNAHFFVVDKNTSVTFDEGKSYALIAQMGNEVCGVASPLLEMTPAPGADKKNYSPVKIQFVEWDEYCDKILQQGSMDIFKFILNMPG